MNKLNFLGPYLVYLFFSLKKFLVQLSHYLNSRLLYYVVEYSVNNFILYLSLSINIDLLNIHEL